MPRKPFKNVEIQNNPGYYSNTVERIMSNLGQKEIVIFLLKESRLSGLKKHYARSSDNNAERGKV